MLPHKKMAPAIAETISNTEFFLFFHCLLDRGHIKGLQGDFLESKDLF